MRALLAALLLFLVPLSLSGHGMERWPASGGAVLGAGGPASGQNGSGGQIIRWGASAASSTSGNCLSSGGQAIGIAAICGLGQVAQLSHIVSATAAPTISRVCCTLIGTPGGMDTAGDIITYTPVWNPSTGATLTIPGTDSASVVTFAFPDTDDLGDVACASVTSLSPFPGMTGTVGAGLHMTVRIDAVNAGGAAIVPTASQCVVHLQ